MFIIFVLVLNEDKYWVVLIYQLSNNESWLLLQNIVEFDFLLL